MYKIFFIPVVVLFFLCSGNQLDKKKKNSPPNKKEEIEIQTPAVTNKTDTSRATATEVPKSKTILFKGGTFLMDYPNGLPQEQPAHEVTVKPFYMDVSPVNVEQFQRLIEATYFNTEAELTNMGGNVWQWSSDHYKSHARSSSPVREDPNIKVIRGGSFFFDEYGEDSFSLSARSMNSYETSFLNTGFRCAKDASSGN